MCVIRGLIGGLKHDGGLQSIASCPIDMVCIPTELSKAQLIICNYHLSSQPHTGWAIWSEWWVGLTNFGCSTFCQALLELIGKLAELADLLGKLV